MATCTFSKAVVAPSRVAFTATRQLPAGLSTAAPLAVRTTLKPQRRMTVQPVQAVPVEVFQIAGEAEFIAGISGVMVAITLIGLAVGFVILRVENAIEEGKI